MEIDERLDYIEFRMNLLREGSEFCKFIYDNEITEGQLRQLYDVMDEMREKIDNGMVISRAEYESKLLDVLDRRRYDYHFCESFAKLLWEENRYAEVFPMVYQDSQKFADLFK